MSYKLCRGTMDPESLGKMMKEFHLHLIMNTITILSIIRPHNFFVYFLTSWQALLLSFHPSIQFVTFLPCRWFPPWAYTRSWTRPGRPWRCWPTPSPAIRSSPSAADAWTSPGCARTGRRDPCNGYSSHHPSGGEIFHHRCSLCFKWQINPPIVYMKCNKISINIYYSAFFNYNLAYLQFILVHLDARWVSDLLKQYMPDWSNNHRKVSKRCWTQILQCFKQLRTNKEKRAARTHCQGGGVRVEDVDPEFLQCFLEDDIHHGVLLTIFRLQVGDLDTHTRFSVKVLILQSVFYCMWCILLLHSCSCCILQENCLFLALWRCFFQTR